MEEDEIDRYDLEINEKEEEIVNPIKNTRIFNHVEPVDENDEAYFSKI